MCSGVSCCAFPVPSALCGPLLCCAGAWCCWLLVVPPVFGGPLVALVAWRCLLVVCVGLGVRILPRLPSLGVFPVVSCSPVLCHVVLCCGTLSSVFFALLVALVFRFPITIFCKTRKKIFRFLKIN